MSLFFKKNKSGNTLVITLIVLVGVGAGLALTSDRLVGTRNLQAINLAKQQASYAAETVASLVETKLVQSSGDLNTLTEDVSSLGSGGVETITERWLQQGLFSGDATNTKGMWIGNCLVYWRIEPVKIYDKTISTKSGAKEQFDSTDDLGDSYADNYQANPNEIVKATKSWAGSSVNEMNPGYYHFKITTQAFYLDPRSYSGSEFDLNTADPWNTAGMSMASAQTQRMVQLKLINLFRYVIFYGASGPTGDIEMHPGPRLDINGAVHSNGALYMGGGGTGYLSGNYHGAASSGTIINIGTASQVVTVTGVDGIFRMRKAGNYYYQNQYNMNPTYQEPYNIPTDHTLNGNDATSTNISLNGTALNFKNDSRSGLTGHSDYVRDRKNRGAQVVNTLANIPQLSGYPFEPQNLVGQGQQLWQKPNGEYTVRPTDYPGSVKLYYTNPAGGVFNPGIAPTSYPVYATDMPLYAITNSSGKIVYDVNPTQPLTATYNVTVGGMMNGDPDVPNKADTFLHHPANQKVALVDGEAARGYYLQQSLFGKAGSGTTGLTIRERGAQNTAWDMYDKNGNKINGIAAYPLRGDYFSDADYARAMSCYLARNYVVYLGLVNGVPVDITDTFFGINDSLGNPMGGFSNINDLPVTEDQFMNFREADSYRRLGLLDGISAPNYKVNVLTLNIERILTLIRSTSWGAVSPGTILDPTIATRTMFNGLIYVHRTPRFGTLSGGTPIYDPLAPLVYHPLARPAQVNAAGIDQFTQGLYPIVGSVKTGKTNTPTDKPYYIGDPNFSTWAVYPFTKQVRVKNGATIDWGMTQKSGRLQGLTVITPNHCYIQGDYNITKDATNELPPCGLYADGVTMLTNAWQDSNAAWKVRPTGTTTTYNVSLVINNIPTDSENGWDEGSGGTHNLCRFVEAGSREFRYLGSMVVLNRLRYGRNYIGAALGYYGAPKRLMNFNNDLLSAEGQPPFSPWGIQVTRVVSSVNLINN